MDTNKNILIHEDDKYDVQKFLLHHPGGCNYIHVYKGNKVRKKMAETYHSKSAMYLLREYKLEGRDERIIDGNEDLEKLVDWNKPILAQVGSLGSRYNDWVSSPVDRNLRLFESTFLEALTICPWFLVPIFWVPVMLGFLYSGIYTLTNNSQDPTGGICLRIITSFGIGFTIWSLLEYSLHRWLFHMAPSGESKAFIYVHFTLHGMHHKVPFDSRRLVFPIFPAALIGIFLYVIYKHIFPPCLVDIIASGTTFGYLAYDMIHYYLHHGKPKENTYLYSMKRYHNQHHFSHMESGFGVSNNFWDYIFGTAITLRKLAMEIKW